MNLNLCLKKLVEQNLSSYPPEGVEMPDYETLVASAANKNWTVPALELFESVWADVQLDIAKSAKIEYFNQLSFELRNNILPDYKLANASLGVYDENTIIQYSSLIQAFREEFYRLKALIENAESIEEVNNIQANFPTILNSEF